MSDGRHIHDSGRKEAPANDPVHRLLSLSGPCPELTPEQSARLKASVRPHWQAVVRRPSDRGRRTLPWWRAWMLGGGLAAAAATLLWALGLRSIQPLGAPVERHAPLAEMVAASGEVLRSSSGAPLADASRLDAGEKLYPGDRLRTGVARAALRLAGGTSLRLDTETRVELAAAGRLILVSGAVYVDSEGGGAVEVHTEMGVVEEIGTQFEVRIVGSGLRLRVREGAVVLHHDRGDDEGRRGEELLYVPGSPLRRGAVSSYSGAWSWVQEVAPAIDLDDRTLESYLRWVSRETGRELRFVDPGLEKMAATNLVHGDIVDLQPQESLAVILPACGVRHRVEDGVLTIEPLY